MEGNTAEKAPGDLGVPELADQKVDETGPSAGSEEGDAMIQGAPWGAGSAPSLPSVDSEEQGSDHDSAVGGFSRMTSTVSLRSSIYEHVEENGRTYHRYKQGKYPLPNDEQEQERLDLQHATMNVTLGGKLYLAPIPQNVHNVLDIATGTGIWAIEFANLHPSARVLGTDLSAIQPLYVPPNCRFEIDDAEDEWVFSEKFDFIHGRALLTCFKDPASVLLQAFHSLAPGGYLELQDGYFPLGFASPPPSTSYLKRWSDICMSGAEISGRPWTNAKHYKTWMEEIGFEDVQEKVFYWPTSAWAKGRYFKEISMYWQQNLMQGLEGLSLKVFEYAGWSAEETRVFLAGVRGELKDTSVTAYLTIVVVWGRKPVDTAAGAKPAESSVAES